MSDLGQEPTREPRPKRIKIDVACDTCRARKVKCDGVRPSCGNCTRKIALQGTCKYSQSAASSGTKPSTDSQASGLNNESREPFITPNRLISNVFSDADQSRRREQNQSVAAEAPGTAVSLAYQPRAPNLGESTSPRAISTGSRAPASAHTHSPSIIDSMTAVVDEGTSTREYFGSSSAGSFTTQIKKAIDARLGQRTFTPTNNPPSLQHYNGTTSTASNAINDAHRVLPTRRQADHLLGLYWHYVDPLYPFLDKVGWEKSYHAIFDGTTTIIDEQIFLASLNVIFALSSQLMESQDLDQREESSRVFFDRAQGLLPLNTWEPASTELLQYLLLTSQYLQSTERPHQTWMVVGSAVRIAQGIGLHLSETSAEHPDPKERELLRRIWYGCVLMDRMVAVTHGRPAMISTYVASAVPLPLTHTDRHEAVASTLDSSTDTGFFVKSVQLYELIHRTIQSLYHGARCKSVAAPNDENGNGGVDKSKTDLGMVMQFDAALDKWDRGLPEHLRWAYSQPRDQVTQRQAVILYLRFLHARILLLRPVLASFCLSYQGGDSVDVTDSLEVRTLRECAMMCVSTAQNIISALLKYQTIDGSMGYLPAWWYRVYYVYTAATVLIAAKLRPEVLPESDFNQAWDQAMSILRDHEKFGQSARRCGTALQLLCAKIQQPDASGPKSQDAEGSNSQRPLQTLDTASGARMEEDFSFSGGDLNQMGLQYLDFDVNNLAWLNDMQAAWELLNHDG